MLHETSWLNKMFSLFLHNKKSIYLEKEAETKMMMSKPQDTK